MIDCKENRKKVWKILNEGEQGLEILADTILHHFFCEPCRNYYRKKVMEKY